MEIKTLKIGDIHPYEKNPRKNDKSVAAVARSIEEFGWQQPIVVDASQWLTITLFTFTIAKHERQF